MSIWSRKPHFVVNNLWQILHSNFPLFSPVWSFICFRKLWFDASNLWQILHSNFLPLFSLQWLDFVSESSESFGSVSFNENIGTWFVFNVGFDTVSVSNLDSELSIVSMDEKWTLLFKFELDIISCSFSICWCSFSIHINCWNNAFCISIMMSFFCCNNFVIWSLYLSSNCSINLLWFAINLCFHTATAMFPFKNSGIIVF